MTTSVAIMGAGPGGLASAMLLASKGMNVDVYERAQSVGGRSAKLRIDGFEFDRGPTFFLYPQVLNEIFQECGKNLDDYIDLIKLDPQYHLIFENRGDINATPNIEKMRSEIAKFSKIDAHNLDRFISDNRQKLKLFKPILEQSFSGIRDLCSLAMLKSLPLLKPHHSVDRDLQKYFSHPLVRLAFSFQSKYLGMSPFQCPSLFTILSFMEYEHGVYHPRGGCSQVMEVMARLASEMGVRFHLGKPVEKVHFNGKKFQGIQSADGFQRADALIVNADFGHFVNHFVPPHLLRKWHKSKLKKKKFSCSTLMIYLGIKGHYDHLEHHTILLSEGYEEFLHEIEKGGSLPSEPSIYVQNACKTDDSLSPAEHSTLYILVPVANMKNPIDWRKQKYEFRKSIFERLKIIGLDDLEERIVVEKIVTPLDWESDLSIHLGATFNLSHCLSQLLFLRPNNRFEELESVYLTGGGTHPGSGLPVIFEGARITSKLIGEDLSRAKLQFGAKRARPEMISG